MLNLLSIPVAINLGGASIALLDAICAAVLLISLIVGSIKGFIKQQHVVFSGKMDYSFVC